MTSAPWCQTTQPWSGKQSERTCFFPLFKTFCLANVRGISKIKKKGAKKNQSVMSSGRLDVSLLRRALHYERDTGEVSSIVGFCVCVRVVVNPPKPKKKIPIFFPPPSLFSTDTQSLG